MSIVVSFHKLILAFTSIQKFLFFVYIKMLYLDLLETFRVVCGSERELCILSNALEYCCTLCLRSHKIIFSFPVQTVRK